MTARSAMDDFREGFRSNFIPSLRRPPREFFAPLISLSRWMARISEEGSAPPKSTFTLSASAQKSLTVASHRLGTPPLLTLELAIHQLDARTAVNARGRYHPSGLPIPRRPLDPESRNRWTTSPCLAYRRTNRLDMGME
jgi:hypothetical protein